MADVNAPKRRRPDQPLGACETPVKRVATKRKAGKYACYVCPHKCRDNDALRVHMRRHNGQGGYYLCVICSRKYATDVVLKVHLRSHGVVGHHVYTYVPPLLYFGRGPLYSCSGCPKMFAHKGDLTRHEQSRHVVRHEWPLVLALFNETTRRRTALTA